MPLSNDVRSRQFIKIFKKQDGVYESMIQRVCRQIRQADEQASITVSTSKAQVSAVHNQLGEAVNVCVEPNRKGTFPGIALTAAYLHDHRQLSEEEVVIVCPIDPYVEDSYYAELKSWRDWWKQELRLRCLAFSRRRPVNYGYIVPENDGEQAW